MQNVRRDPRLAPPAAWAALAALAVLAAAVPALARPRDYAVEIHASIEEAPPAVHLAWIADPAAQSYWVFKKQLPDTTWREPVAVLPGTATGYSDHEVSLGKSFEYSVRKTLGFVADTVRVPTETPLTFTIRDAWGDGICCEHGLGEYAVTSGGITYAAGGAFGSVEATSFIVETAEQPEVDLVVSITLDLFGQETTWELENDATGTILAAGGPYAPPKFGHILVGLRAPASEEFGTVLLLVEADIATHLGPEIERLELDMIRDGWRVRRHEVGDWIDVPEVKNLIVGECANDPSINTLFLLGHIAVPYSGDIRGVHPDHWGAWPADLYYGELDGAWSDSIVYNVSAARPENRNVPGDGKFDQSFLPSDVDLQVGRVDLSRLPAFPQDEVVLLRRYLDKDHAWRSGEVDVEARGLIDDNVGDAYGAAFAAFGWRNFTAMFGPENVHAGNFVPDLQSQSHLWAYGCGGSSYTSCGGVANTNDFATRTFLSVFTILYGSYFGDWDNSNNLLRAPLGAQGYPLANVWCGRPTWQMHPMALGWPIGCCARITQNNRTLYTIGDGGRQVHTALMGDPTLRQHAVQPPTALYISPPASRGCLLTWSPSPDPVEGYHVFRSGCLRDRFVRITAAPVADTFYVDPAPNQGRNVYAVRGLLLQESASGSYYNLSPGAIDSVEVTSQSGPEGPSERGRQLAIACRPSPCGASTRIFCELPREDEVELRILDVTGACVRVIANGRLGPGAQAWRWDGRDDRGRLVPTGIYQLSLRAGQEQRSGRVCVLR